MASQDRPYMSELPDMPPLMQPRVHAVDMQLQRLDEIVCDTPRCGKNATKYVAGGEAQRSVLCEECCRRLMGWFDPLRTDQ